MRSIIFFFILSSIKLSECIPSSSHVNTGLSAVARSEDVRFIYFESILSFHASLLLILLDVTFKILKPPYNGRKF